MPDNWDCHAYVIQRTFSARIPPNPTPRAIRDWFDSAAEAAVPVHDGTIGTARLAADAYARRAKADNTRRAYRAGEPVTASRLESARAACQRVLC